MLVIDDTAAMNRADRCAEQRRGRIGDIEPVGLPAPHQRGRLCGETQRGQTPEIHPVTGIRKIVGDGKRVVLAEPDAEIADLVPFAPPQPPGAHRRRKTAGVRILDIEDFHRV